LRIAETRHAVPQIMSVIAGFRSRIAVQPERYVLAGSVEDVESAAASGRLAIGFDLEGALPLQEQPEMVAFYRDLGVRQIHLAYNRNNSVAGGCHDTERGLTPLETWTQSAAALQAPGMTAAQAALVMGGNMAPVARRVWRAPG
jgi:membrane dipeptidase